MAFPSVRSSTTSNQADATTHQITMPATIEADDLLLSIVCLDGTPGPTLSNLLGTWTLIHDGNTAGSERVFVMALIADGTEDSGTEEFTSTASERSSHITMSIKDWFGTISTGVFDSPGVTEVTANPDPDNCDPSFDGDVMWIGIEGHNTGTDVQIFPEADNNLEEKGGSGGGRVTIASCSVEANAGSRDIGQFTIGTSRNTRALAVAIRPAGAVAALIERALIHSQAVSRAANY